MAKTVLVCDDSMLMRKMVAECLTEDGWTIVGEASDGNMAIELYKELTPDAVTMDMVMPEFDGLHGLRGIIEINPEAKVVMVSALAQTKSISEAIRSGAQDFITKPFMPEQLQQTIGACLDTTAS
ncbi:MAG: response regulator [Pirellulaceae bacterium]|nr:response regulator [Pirellulaceae bacterium]